jgi:hypothetical protein
MEITEDPYHTIIIKDTLHKIQTLNCNTSWKIKFSYLYSESFQKISAVPMTNNRGISPGHEGISKSGTKNVKRY